MVCTGEGSCDAYDWSSSCVIFVTVEGVRRFLSEWSVGGFEKGRWCVIFTRVDGSVNWPRLE